MQEEKIKAGHRTVAAEGESRGSIWRARVRAVVLEILWGCAAWVLGQARMAFDTYPLGLGLLCASPRHTVSILIGLLLTTFSNLENFVIYICIYLAAALIRVFASMLLDAPDARVELPESLRQKLFRTPSNGGAEDNDPADADQTDDETKFSRMRRRMRRADGREGRFSVLRQELSSIFSESVCLRMATAGVCALVLGIYAIAAGGFQFYDWFGAIFCVITAAVSVMVFSISLEARCQSAWLRRISEGSLLFALVFAARHVAMLTFPLSPILALFFTLYACCMRGGAQGILAGLVCGVAFSPLHAPGLLLAALAYLFLHHAEKQTAGVLLASLSMLLWSVYISGASILLSLLPAVLIAATGFTLMQRILKITEEAGEAASAASVDTHLQEQVDRRRRQDANERFRGISDAFSSLSEVFYNLSDRFRRPGTLDLRHLCDRAFDSFCAECPNKSVCWGVEYTATLAGVNDLIAQLHTRGRVFGEQIPAQLQHRCNRMDGILEEINRECARLTGEMLRNNRTEIFAMDYEAAAEIINDALEEEDGEYRFDPETERKIAEYLNDAGVRFGSVTVYGTRCRRIHVRGVDIDRAKVSFETLCSDVGELCGSKLGAPVFEVENNVSTMILQAKQKVAITGAQNNISADGGVSGDTVNLFSNKKDYFYALISDGMGAGREAALTSNLCSVFLEKMLRAGNRAGTSLRMLNNMIRSRGADSRRECSSTIDLLELDLMTGNASFIKSGAAPGFVIRGNVVRRLQAGTVPIGIICTLDAQETAFELCPGDTVVMISDGILQKDAECEWLTDYLTGAGELSPEEIVYQICLHAAEQDGHDDCSAIALRVHAAGSLESEAAS